MVHGRFQPFHRGHLEYLLDAAGHCSSLIVGITNPDLSRVPLEISSPHRHLAESNPYSYPQRAEMIRAALVDAQVDLRRVDVVPFPIHDHSQWSHAAPPGTTHFIRVFSAWEQEKAARLRAGGYEVVELSAPAVKGISGSEVRRRMAVGGDWRSLVPRAVADLIDAWPAPVGRKL